MSGLEEVAKQVRADVLQMCHTSHAAHVGSSLSCVDILVTLYYQSARVDPAAPTARDRDVIIVSKGHAAAAYYAVLANRGFFSRSILSNYCQDGQLLGGHVTSGLIPGVELSTGSLGHGLPFGVGVAIAQSLTSGHRRTFVLVSDGECDEGSTWEAALQAAHFRLGNLVVLIDRNRLQSLKDTESTMRLEPLREKWMSFGWEVVTVDGHAIDQISACLEQLRDSTKPTVLICETVKGKGVSFMENQVEWHYKSPSSTELAQALIEINHEE